MTADTKPEPLEFILVAAKRGVRRVSRQAEWEPDDEGFLERWPNNTRPDIATQRSANADDLAPIAKRLNDAQINANFLDWLYYVDVNAPVHYKCDETCAPRRAES